MKKILMLFCLFCIFTFIPKCNADECNYTKLKEFADKVSVTSEFDEDSLAIGIYGNNLITVYGITKDIYAMTDDGSVGFYYSDVENGSITKRVDSDVTQIKIYSDGCSDKLLRTIDVTLKVYNPFHTSDDCVGLEKTLDVCAKYVDKGLSLEEFNKALDEYLNANKNKDSDVTKNDILTLIKKYGIFIGIGLIVLVGVISVLIVRHIKKNKLD